MSNEDFQLKLQSYLDGELSGSDAAEVQARLDRDPAAKSLFDELSHTCAALSGHEAGCRLPETREFFWFKIEREIERQDRPAVVSRESSWYAWLHRHFLPVSGVALLSCLLGVVALRSEKSGGQSGQMNLVSEDMRAYTFRDPQQQMTMVWLYSDDSQFTAPPALASMDTE